jgi:hypothetical protein
MAIFGGPSPSPFVQPDCRKAGQVAFAALYKALFVAVIVYCYLDWTTPLHRAAAVVAAPLFALIETFWTTITHEDAVTGKVTVKGWQGRLGHSSFAQFWANVIFTPMLLFGYRALAPDIPILRVIWFPLNVWWLEIVEGYIIMFLFGRNVAWEYRGAEAFCHGNITMQYYAPWFGLGLIVELVWDSVLLPLAAVIASDTGSSSAASTECSISSLLSTTPSTVATVLLCAAALTLFCSPRLSLCSLYQSVSTGEFKDY